MAWIEWYLERRTGRRMARVRWRSADGRKPFRDLNTSDPDVAELERQLTQQREEGRASARPNITADAREALKRFLTHLGLTRSQKTVRFYERLLREVWKGMAPAPLPSWTRAQFEAWLAKRTKVEGSPELAWSPRTIQMHVAACKRFIRWAREEAEDVACPDFVRRFRGPAVHRSQPQALTREQLLALLATARGEPLEMPVALAGLAGLRRAEFERVQASDLNWKAKTLLVRAEKAHKDRVVPVTEDLAKILRRHPRAAGALVRANKGVRNMHRALHGLCKRAGVPRIGWHALRHTCASLMVADGARLTAVRDMLGHANLSTTSIHLHSTDQEVREAAGKVLGG